MAQAYRSRTPPLTNTAAGRRRRRPNRGAIFLIVLGGLLSFAAGFVLMWSVGSWLRGGEGLPSFLRPGPVVEEALAAPPFNFPVAPAVDLTTFRDLSYTPVRGIYVTGYGAGSSELFDPLLALADETEINAMVIDVKDDSGVLTYDSAIPLVNELGLEEERIGDISGLVAKLHQHDLVPIARLVCFKDPKFARKNPELAVQDKDGGLWKDRKGFPFINPYKREAWDYLVDVAEEAADLGFREIQFDYVRFPTDGKISDCVYPGEWGEKEDAIAGFLAYARARLEKKGVWVSADVFGLTLHDSDDMGIGQQIEKVSSNVDIVCPMVYPSHYYSNSYGVADPNRSPYEIITAAMKDANARVPGTGALVRPWLQDFSLSGVTYGVAEVKAQIKAAEEQGITEWLLWDPSLKYTEGALRPE